MKAIDFSKIAAQYEGTSLVQKSASDELFDLLNIGETDEVLDIGCGTGNITWQIRKLTKGKVVGIDAAEGMIEEARLNYGKFDIEFQVSKAEELNYLESFDAIFCNSTFQWLKPLEPVLIRCYEALRPDGKMGIQAPACNVYSPNFIEAIEAVKKNPDTRQVFEHFQSPWIFFDTAQEYSELFRNAGFEVIYSQIVQVATKYTSEEAFAIFDSGAAAGYLNQTYYDTPVDDTYIEKFREIVSASFAEQATEQGKLDLVFNRIYMIARKQ